MKKIVFLLLLVFLLPISSWGTTYVTLGKFHWVDRGSFRLEGRKYLGENEYEKAFVWDGQMAFGFRAIGYDRVSFLTYFMFQPVVARSYDKKIRVSGQVYHLAGSIEYAITENVRPSVSLIHLSTHITQDIEHPFYMDLPRLPPGLLSDANVVAFGISGKSGLGAPIPWKWSVAFQPINLALTEGLKNSHYERPLYFLLEATTWESSDFRNVVSAEGELGDKKQSAAKLETRVEFLNWIGESPMQIFVNKFFAPHDVSSSPRLGFFPAEFALGIRFVFETR